MSVEAITWVLRDAPGVPPHLVTVLICLANHANDAGAGSYPSQELLAWYARKDERAIRNDLTKLEDLKLIRRGNQLYVAHLPADKRPVVYDLAMERVRPPRPDKGKPGRPRKATGTTDESAAEQQELAGVGDPNENQGNSTSPGLPDDAEKRGELEFRGEVQRKTGGSTAQNGGNCASPKPSLNRPLKETPPTPHDDQAPATAAEATAGEGEISEEDQHLLDAGLAKALLLKTRWNKVRVMRVMRQAVKDGRNAKDVAVAITVAAQDAQSRTPNRILNDWWWIDNMATTEAEPAGPTCDKAGHQGYPANPCAMCRVDEQQEELDRQRAAKAEQELAEAVRAAELAIESGIETPPVPQQGRRRAVVRGAGRPLGRVRT